MITITATISKPAHGPALSPISLRPRGVIRSSPWVAGFFGVVLLVLVAVPFFPGVRFYYLQVIILVFWFAMIGTAWSIPGGYTGLHSVGNAAFVGVGAYTSTLLYVNFNISPWIGLLIGMVLAGVLAVIVGYPSFRFGLRGDYFVLATVAFGYVVWEVTKGATGITKGSQGIPIPYSSDPWMFQFTDRRVFYFIAMAMWLAVVVVSYYIRRSRLGFQLLAVRDDEAAAARGGISVLRSKLVALVISAVLTAAAGTFYAQFYLFVDPGSVMSLSLSIEIMLMAALGGMGSYLGGTIGAVVLIPVSQILADKLQAISGADFIFYGIVLILIMMYMPYGIAGTLRKKPKWRKVVGW